jgi:hypothetical protein
MCDYGNIHTKNELMASVIAASVGHRGKWALSTKSWSKIVCPHDLETTSPHVDYPGS